MAIANTDVLTALSRVQHPTLGRDLVSLGVVKALAINGGDVS
ncbi:MAG: iron-sulfur cluster assembly protein, partial [Planctomycetota bacterium]